MDQEDTVNCQLNIIFSQTFLCVCARVRVRVCPQLGWDFVRARQELSLNIRPHPHLN